MKERPGKPTSGALEVQGLFLWGHRPGDTGPQLQEASVHHGEDAPAGRARDEGVLRQRASVVEEREWVCRDKKALTHGGGCPGKEGSEESAQWQVLGARRAHTL